MPRRFSRYMGQPELVRGSDLPGVAVVFGVAVLIGLITGLGWIGWKLLQLHVFE